VLAGQLSLAAFDKTDLCKRGRGADEMFTVNAVMGLWHLGAIIAPCLVLA